MAHSLTIYVLCNVLLFTFPSLHLPAQEIDSGINTSQRAYDVRGTVINSVTHEPIARALVTIAGETSSSQLTDNEGRFVFRKVASGTRQLEILSVGMVPVIRAVDVVPNDTTPVAYSIRRITALDPKQPACQQAAKLAGGVRQTVAKRRRLAIRPHTGAVRRDDQQAPIVLEHPPDLAQQPASVLRHLQPVHHQDAVEGQIGERQAVFLSGA